MSFVLLVSVTKVPDSPFRSLSDPMSLTDEYGLQV